LQYLSTATFWQQNANETFMEVMRLESRPTWIPVVALALRDADGRLLLQQRPPHKHHGSLWEFPGGKVESTEFPRLALCREIMEELAITLDPADLQPAYVADEGANGGIVLILYTARCWSGDICGMEGQQWDWFTPAEARQLPMPPMDSTLLERLLQ
jgi:8-oxo-dGTP diphosphatase